MPMLKNTSRYKLATLLLLHSCALIGIMLFTSLWAQQQVMNNFLQQQQAPYIHKALLRIQNYYIQYRDWQGLLNHPAAWERLLQGYAATNTSSSLGLQSFGSQASTQETPLRQASLRTINKEYLLGTKLPEQHLRFHPIMVEGQQVAWLATPDPMQQKHNPAHILSEGFRSTLTVSAIGLFAVSLLMVIFIGRKTIPRRSH